MAKSKIKNEKDIFHGEHMTPVSDTRFFLSELLKQKLPAVELKKEN